VNLLGIVQRACATIGIPQPTSVISNLDDQVQQLLWLTQIAGDDIASGHDWSKLVVVRTFTPTATQEQDEPPAASVAFSRFAPASRMWDVNRRRPIYGPLNRDDWQALLTTTFTGLEKYWTMIGGKVNVYPTPEVTDSFRYTYITKNWIRHNGGDQTTDVDEWTADTDEPLIPASLVYLSTIWRWRQAKGLDYQHDLSMFNDDLGREAARDRGPKEINLSMTPDLPDTVWPGRILAP
jgi:hypothetical protein